MSLIALATLALGFFALVWHRVGDTATESDFYSGYALGARALQHGRLEFGRFGAYGPVYEVLLALAGLCLNDLFTAARLLSVLATALTMLAWWGVAMRRIDATAALALVALLAVNPTLIRYGYSATTDMVAVALFSLSAYASLALRRPWAPALAGVFAGLAALTRYNLLALLPAGVLLIAVDPSPRSRDRARALALYLGGALLVLLPWTLASLAAGHLPGDLLIRDRGFYMGTGPTTPVENRYSDLGASLGTPPAADALHSGLAFLSNLGQGVMVHLWLDTTVLLGPPAAALIAAGLVLAFVLQRLRAFTPFLPVAALTFLSLAPVYHSERYSMVLLPLYLLPAAWLVMTTAHAPWPRPTRLAAAWALSLGVLVPTAAWSLRHQGDVLADLPLEARAAGEAIRARVEPGAGMIARKGHAAYFAGLEPVAFPLVRDLATLAGYCESRGVRYLYYSGVEARSRPSFAYLLDTSVVVPGLSVMRATNDPPCVVYEITPGFGAVPEWWLESSTRRRVRARVNALMQPGPAARPFHLQLATEALLRGRPAEALRDAEAAARLGPTPPDAKLLVAEALRRLGRRDAAIETLRSVLATAPEDAGAQLQLGLLLHEAGRDQEAAKVWRPLVGRTRDAHLLPEMERLFSSLGDRQTARRARASLDALRGHSVGGL